MTDPAPRYHSFVFDSSRWEGFTFRPGDILICTPPKCGTTWTQKICALLILQEPKLPKPLALLSPWLDMMTSTREEVFDLLEAQTHRRFIKTHTPLDGLPHDERITYLSVGRDPRDAGVSMGHHMANLDFEKVFEARAAGVGFDDLPPEVLAAGPPGPPPTGAEWFWGWVDDETPVTANVSTLKATLHNLATFRHAPARLDVAFLRYEDLEADLEGEMRSLAGRLGIDVAESRWPELVEAATFQAMKGDAEMNAPDTPHRIWRDTGSFFHEGRSGQWQEYIHDDATRARYRARVAEVGEPDVAAWAHHGDW